MHFGGAMFFTDSSMSAMELARALEERGFEFVWAPEHSHIPLSRKTPYPGGGELPKQYFDAMDPFVVLAAASQVTRTIKFGTGVLLVQQRDAIQTAKLVASIDQVSQGRFLFGVGGGWNQDEMENHGTVYATRFKRMRESIEAMKEIWTKEEAEYHGEFVNFDPMIARPKPVQKPHPPIHVGGAFPHGARRAIRYGDGWIPVAGGRCRRSPAEIPRDGAGSRARSEFHRDHPVRPWRGSRPAEALRRDGRRAGGPDVPAGEGGHGAADRRPVDQNHAAGEQVDRAQRGKRDRARDLAHSRNVAAASGFIRALRKHRKGTNGQGSTGRCGGPCSRPLTHCRAISSRPAPVGCIAV